MYKKIISLALVALFSLGLLPLQVMAAELGEADIESPDFDLLNKDFPESEVEIVVDGQSVSIDEKTKLASDSDKDAVIEPASIDEDVCGFEVPEEKTYGAQLVAVRRQLRVNTGENFRVKVFMKNTGSMPWFANKSSCLGPKASLGTDNERDHESLFYGEGLEGWEAPNRVAMDQYRTDPGEIASYTFIAKAGTDEDVYKEYFAPVLKDIQWIDDARFSFDVMVGDTGESATDIRKKMTYATTSGSVSNIDLNAEKVAVVDLSEQNLYLKLGDYVVRKFRISSGAAATPTPVGVTSVSLKQQVRIGVKPPHYVMPKFQMFRAGGYGFHALPSLKGDGGIFWTEARNHIGIPVSHGCVRLLPEDADWLFEFTDIGTKVIVQW